MTRQNSSWARKADSTFKNPCNWPSSPTTEANIWSSQLKAEKVYDKTFSKAWLEANFLNLIKGVYKNTFSNHIWYERICSHQSYVDDDKCMGRRSASSARMKSKIKPHGAVTIRTAKTATATLQEEAPVRMCGYNSHTLWLGTQHCKGIWQS